MAIAVEGNRTDPGAKDPVPGGAATPAIPGEELTQRIPVATPAKPDWRYQPAGERDLRLDFLRGLAVFAMVVDHLGGDSWLYALSGGNRFFVSAAELFVFISGITVGIVYGNRARRDGFRAAARKLLARAWTLYALAVWLAITTAFGAAVFGLPHGRSLTENPARFVFQVVTVQRTFYLVDVMLLYAVLLLVAPLALLAVRRRLWWLVALLSWGLWGAYQLAPQQLVIPWRIAENPVFNFAPWQVLFFTGLLLGYGRDWLRRAIVARVPASPLRDGWVAMPALILYLLICVHVTNGMVFDAYLPGGNTAALLDAWFDKSALPPARLAAFAVVFGFLWLLVTRCWQPLRRALGPTILPFGQRALYAYAAHLFLVIAVHAAVTGVWGSGPGGAYPALHPALNALIQLVGLALLWGLTRARFLQGLVSPLGAPPAGVVRIGARSRAMLRPNDSLLAVAGAAAIALTVLGTVAPGGASVAGGAGGGPATGRQAAPPESTVTLPRRIGGDVRGSSGLTGRRDAQPTAAAQAGVTSTPTTVPAVAPAVPAAPPSAARPSPGAAAPTAKPQAVKPSGGYLADGEFFSRTLDRTMPFGIYLPPTYDSDPRRRYPVLYMLHGAGGHYSEWVAYGLPEEAENMVWDGQIQPVIIVMPQGDQSFFANHTAGDEARWGDYIAYDLVDYIDATYRTIPNRASRAIGGLSMGGFGALHLAFLHPDIYGTVGAHSPALPGFLEGMEDIFATPGSFAEADPIDLLDAIDPRYLPHIWIDAGEDDAWTPRVRELIAALDAHKVKHEATILPGSHNADYWNARTGDYLRFYTTWLVGGPPGVGAAR